MYTCVCATYALCLSFFYHLFYSSSSSFFQFFGTRMKKDVEELITCVFFFFSPLSLSIALRWTMGRVGEGGWWEETLVDSCTRCTRWAYQSLSARVVHAVRHRAHCCGVLWEGKKEGRRVWILLCIDACSMGGPPSIAIAETGEDSLSLSFSILKWWMNSSSTRLCVCVSLSLCVWPILSLS